MQSCACDFTLYIQILIIPTNRVIDQHDCVLWSSHGIVTAECVH